jgi:beta-glucanase (GH16 family)
MDGSCGRSWTPPFYVEVSALFNPITGNWPAIWMQPVQRNIAQTLAQMDGVNYGEIDLFEWQSSNAADGYSSIHVWNDGSDISNNSGSNTWSIPGGSSVLSSYNTYGALVTKKAITWYFNNAEVLSVSTTASPYNTVFAGQQSYFLMLAEQAGCNFVSGTCSEMAGPFNMQVQWVHIFAPPTAAGGFIFGGSR